MTKLPIVSGRDCIKALQRAGFAIRRQRGSHIVLTKGSLTVGSQITKSLTGQL